MAWGTQTQHLKGWNKPQHAFQENQKRRRKTIKDKDNDLAARKKIFVEEKEIEWFAEEKTDND